MPAILPLGDVAVLVRFGDALSAEANREAIAFAARLDADVPEGVEEIAPGLVSVLKIPCWRKYALRSFSDAALRKKKNSLVMCMRILKTRKSPREWVFLRLLYANAKNVCSENFVKIHRKNFLALEDSRLTKHSSNF